MVPIFNGRERKKDKYSYPLLFRPALRLGKGRIKNKKKEEGGKEEGGNHLFSSIFLRGKERKDERSCLASSGKKEKIDLFYLQLGREGGDLSFSLLTS